MASDRSIHDSCRLMVLTLSWTRFALHPGMGCSLRNSLACLRLIDSYFLVKVAK